MAEVVEYRVSRTLDELNLLVEFGIFDKHNAKEIISKREDFEYTLRRRTKTKLDYLKYIRFEVNLLESIDNYKKHVIKENIKPKEGATETEEIERKIQLLQAKKLNDVIRSRCAHISSLFRKLTTSFQFDKNLWMAYIDFAKSRKWNTRVTALYWRLLRVHSEDPDIWLAAAKHELETNKAYETARGLFLRALRHHPRSDKIWAEYFRMELCYMDVVDQRAKVVFKTLKNNKLADEAEEAAWEEDTIKSDEEDQTEDEDKGEKIPEEPCLSEDDAIITGHLPKVVYKNAVETLKSDEELYRFIVSALNYIYTWHSKSKGVESTLGLIIDDIRKRNAEKDDKIIDELAKNCQDASFIEKVHRKLYDVQSTSPVKRAKVALSMMERLYECYESKGIEATRELFNQLDKSVKTQTLSLYVGMIQVEEKWELPKAKDERIIRIICDTYEKALMKFGKTNPKLWYEYLLFRYKQALDTMNLSDFEAINQIYQRAQATLETNKIDKLVEKYTMIQSKTSKKELDYDIEHSDYSDLEE